MPGPRRRAFPASLPPAKGDVAAAPRCLPGAHGRQRRGAASGAGWPEAVCERRRRRRAGARAGPAQGLAAGGGGGAGGIRSYGKADARALSDSLGPAPRLQPRPGRSRAAGGQRGPEHQIPRENRSKSTEQSRKGKTFSPSLCLCIFLYGKGRWLGGLGWVFSPLFLLPGCLPAGVRWRGGWSAGAVFSAGASAVRRPR